MARAAASVLLQQGLSSQQVLSSPQGLSSQQGLASRRGSARDHSRDHALLKAKPKFGQSFVGPTWVSSRDLTSSGRGGGGAAGTLNQASDIGSESATREDDSDADPSIAGTEEDEAEAEEEAEEEDEEEAAAEVEEVFAPISLRPYVLSRPSFSSFWTMRFKVYTVFHTQTRTVAPSTGLIVSRTTQPSLVADSAVLKASSSTSFR